MRVSTIISVSKALNDAGVRFIVCGGQAVVAHGYVRFTADLDIAIRLDGDSIRKALDALGAAGYRTTLPVTAEQIADAKTRERGAQEKNMTVLNFVSDADPLGTIDVLIQNQFDFDAEYAAADVIELIPGLSWRVLRLDALIAMKLAVGPPGGSRRRGSPAGAERNAGRTMTQTKGSESIADAPAGDGTFAGARKLYLERGLKLPLIERLRAVEEMAEAAALIQRAASKARRGADAG